MKLNRCNRFLSILRHLFAAPALVISFFGAAHATQIDWSGTTDTTWATGTNWAGTAPANSITTDTARFNLPTYPKQPNAGTTSITGLVFGDGATATAPLTLSGTQLTIGASGIDMKASAGAANISSPVTLGAAQTWQNASASDLTVSGAVTAAANLLTVNGASNTAISGAIGGTGGLVKLGAGTLTLSGTGSGNTGAFNVKQGTLTVSGGTITAANQIKVGDTGGSGTPIFNLTGGAVTATVSGNALYIGGTASFPGSVTVSGGTFNCSTAGAILTVGDNAPGTYSQTGGTVNSGSTGGLWIANNAGGTGSTVDISSGIFNMPGTSVLGVRGSYAFTVSGSAAVNMGTLQLGHTGGTTNNPTGRITNLNGGTLKLTSGIAYAAGTATVNLNGGILQANSSATGFWNNNSNVTATIGASGITIDTQAFNDTISQVLGGNGGLTKTGSGALVLSGANNYTGPTNVKNGSLAILESTTTNGISLDNGASLTINGTTGTTIGGASPIANLTLGSTPGAGGASLTFNNFASNTGQQLVDTTNFTTKGAAQGVIINLAGTFTGTGDFPLISFGNPTIGGDGYAALKLGTLPRSIAGNIYEDGQVLWLKVTGFNPLKWNGTVPGGVWDINSAANWQGIDTKYLDGDIVAFDSTATGTTNVALNTTVSPSGVTVSNASYSIAGTGTIAGNSGLTKDGTGTLTLSTNNSFSGLTSINGGTVKAGHANAFGSTASRTEVASGAVLDLNGTALGAEPITLNGMGISATGALVNNSAIAASASSPITLGAAASVGGSGSMTLSADITGTTGLTKVGGGVTSFSSKKSYTGDTVINGGTLNLTGGGGSGGAIRGIATVNTGATLQISTGDATGYALGTDRLTAINVLEGAMVVAVANNQTLGAAALTLRGATLTGVSGSNLDFYTDNNALPGRSSFSTLGSSTTSVVSGVKLNSRQDDGLIFDVADGVAGIDLDVQSNISGSGFTNNQIVKNGLGTMMISGLSTYTVPTVVNAGALIVPSVQSSQSFDVTDNASLSIIGAPGSSFSVDTLRVGHGTGASLSIGNFGEQTTAALAPVKASGTLDLYGSINLAVSGSFTTAGTYPLFSYPAGGYVPGSFATVPLSLPPNVSGFLQDNPGNNTMDLVLSSVNTLIWNGNLPGGLWNVNGAANWIPNPSAPAGKYQENMVVRLDDSAIGTAVTLNSQLSPSSVTVNNSTQNYTLSGTGGITGSTGLTKMGTGSLTLNTANTYTGLTTISAGTLQLGNGTANGSVAGNILNNANLALNNGATAQTYAGVVSGSGSLSKIGTGTFTLGGTNTYLGTTTINGGTLRVTGTVGTGAVVDNANLEFNRTDATQVNPVGVLTGTGNVRYTGPAIQTSLAGQFLVDDTNSYGGTTTVTSNCRVNLTNLSGLSNGAVTVDNGSGILFNTVASVFNNPITLNGPGWLETAGQLGAIRITGSTNLTGPLTLGSSSRISVYGGAGIVSGVISGGYDLSLTGSSNANLLILGGASANTYNGTTTLSNVQVSLAKSSGVAIPGDIVMDNTTSPLIWATASNQVSGSNLLTFTGNSGNARLNLTGTTQTFRGIVNNSTAATAVIQNSEAIGGGANASPLDYGTSNLVLNVPTGEDYAFLNGYLRNQTGVVNVVKNGLGSQTLSAANIVYTGTTMVNAGTLKFTSTSALATSIANSATVEINSVTGDDWVDANKTLSGSGTWNKTGAGRASFANCTITASGQINIQAGTLRNNNNASNWTASTANIDVSSAAILDLYADAIYLNKLTGSGFVQSSYGNLTGQSGATASIEKLVVGVANGNATFSGVIRNNTANTALGSGVEAGGLQFEKVGTGTQTLSGINLYTGQTFVRSGTLALGAGGTINTSSAVTLSSGAILDVAASSFTQITGQSLTGGRTSGSGNDIVGNLSTGGIVNVAGSGIAGTLKVSGNLALTGGGSLQLDLSPSAASGNDKIVAGGTLTLASTAVSPTFNGTPDTANPYTIMSGASVVGDASTLLTNGLLNSRYALTFDSTTSPGNVLMNVTGTGKAQVWSGAAAGVWVADLTTLNWNANSGPADYFQNLDSVTFNDTNANGTVTLNTTVTPSLMTVSSDTTAYTFTGTGSIAGGGSLTKSGATTLTLATTGTNSYGGGTVINGGVVSVGNGANELASALGTGTVTVNSTGTLWFKPGSSSSVFNFAPSFVLNGGTITGEDGTQRLGTGSGATVNIGAAGGTVQATWGGKDVYIDGQMTGSGPLAISHGPTAGATATVHLTNNANTYSGTVGVSGAGTGAILAIDAPNALQYATVNLNPGTAGTLLLGTAGMTYSLPGLTGSAGTIKPNTAAGIYTLAVNNSADFTYGGTLVNNTGVLALNKTGGGKLTLGGVNTNTGATHVFTGTLALANASALSGSTLYYDNEGGTVDFTGLTALNLGGLQGAQNLTLPSTVTALTVGNTGNSDTAVYTGTITLPGAGATFTKQGIGNQTLGGSTSNSWAGNTSIISNGAPGNSSQGNLYLAKTGGAVAIPANTTVNFGTGTNTGAPNLRTVYDNQFGANVVMNFGNTTGGYCRFDLLGTTQTLAGVTGSAGGAVIQNTGLGNYTGLDAANAATLVLTGTGTYSYTGIIRDTDVGANPLRRLNINKTGSGSQTFAAVNAGAFTGSTTVSAGTLVLNRSAAGDDYYSSTAYSVAPGAVLQFDATVSGRVSQQTADITGAGTIRKTGAGITYWANNGSSTQIFLNLGVTGLVDVQAGNLNSISTRATNMADVLIAGGATLTVNGAGGSATTAYFDALNGGTSASNATLDLGRMTVLGMGDSTGAGLFYGNITGAGGITKEGAGTLTLSAALAGSPAVPTSTSSFSGNIIVNGGKLVGAAKGSVLGSASNTRTITVNSGTTLELQGPNTFGGHSTTNAPTIVVNNGTVTNSDPLASNVINNGLHDITLNSGTLTSTAGNGVLGDIDAVNRPGEVYGAWGINGTLTSTGTSLVSTSAGIAGRVLLGSGVNTTMNVVDGTLTVSAPLQSGDAGFLGGLVKTGVGKLVLSGANVYGSATTITGGTLELTGSLLAASGVTLPSNITVGSSGTLQGTGTATGTLTVDGIVAPGSSIGTLAVGATTFDATGSLHSEINSSTLAADRLAITGNLTIAPGATLNIADLGSGTPANVKLVLVTYTGAWDNGTFAGLPDDSTVVVNGNSYTISYNDTASGANAVTLRKGVVADDPFDAWATSFGLTGADALKGADPDHDGVNNLLEFATNSNPTSGSSGPRVYPLMYMIGADNALTYTMAVRTGAVFAPSGTKQTATQDQVRYTVEASNELSAWNVVPVTEVTGASATAIQTALGSKLTAPPIGADWQWHTFRTDAGAQVDPSDFIRLQVTEAP